MAKGRATLSAHCLTDPHHGITGATLTTPSAEIPAQEHVRFPLREHTSYIYSPACHQVHRNTSCDHLRPSSQNGYG
jgi:hypothetical protein